MHAPMSTVKAVLLAGWATLVAEPGAAQAPAAPAGPDPGVRLIRLINRPEIRVSRIELDAGAARAVHAHDEVEYHVWVSLEGRLEITIAPDGPVVAEAGQAFFMTRGTQHGFRNVGSGAAAVMEIFVQRSSVSASRETAELLGQVMAQIHTGGGKP